MNLIQSFSNEDTRADNPALTKKQPVVDHQYQTSMNVHVEIESKIWNIYYKIV